jgi:uncharacterized protein (DUF885 family)
MALLRIAASASLALLALGACSPSGETMDAPLRSALTGIARDEFVASPELVRRLSPSAERFGPFSSTPVEDRSMAAAERRSLARLEALHALELLDAAPLSPAAQIDRLGALVSLETATRLDRYPYGFVRPGEAGPYVLNQEDGAFIRLPRELISGPPIASARDADAWLERLEGLAAAMTDERRRFELDADQGASPPRRILELALLKARALRPGDPASHPLVLHLSEALSQVPNLPEGEITKRLRRAEAILSGEITTTFDDLIKSLETRLAAAPEAPGVWRLPRGEAYYTDLLARETGGDLTPEQVHEVGLALVRQITTELDRALVRLGRIQGPVGARLQLMARDPAYLLPDTLQGRDQMIEIVAARQAWGLKRSAGLVALANPPLVRLRLAGESPLGEIPEPAVFQPAPLSGGGEAELELHAGANTDWPTWRLPAMSYRDTYPGRQLAASWIRRKDGPQGLDALTPEGPTALGWAIYAGDLAAEGGAYDTDPAGRIGYLQALLLEAARMAADSGLHSRRWSWEQAVTYLVDTTGLDRARMEVEVDRMTVWPGRACAGMIAREKIRNLRADAETELGKAFDLRSFHDVVLSSSGGPLVRLEKRVQAWTNARRAGGASP